LFRLRAASAPDCRDLTHPKRLVSVAAIGVAEEPAAGSFCAWKGKRHPIRQLDSSFRVGLDWRLYRGLPQGRYQSGMRKVALITGINGQDGSYLAELLLSKGYTVHGIVRRVALEYPQHRLARLEPILSQLTLHAASLESAASLLKVVEETQPDECYHLAAQSFVSYSFEDEFSTLNSNINGTHHLLWAIKTRAPKCRFYFAGSSEMFGKAVETPQRETTRFNPRSPYAISKVTGYELTKHYREVHRLHATTGILFNHESPRRGFEFVTRKITMGVAKILAGMEKKLTLGNLEARRDWGHAREYVEAMWLMLQQDDPDDYVIATGECHSVKEFAELAFSYVGLDWRQYVEVDPSLYRPAEVDTLLGDATKARSKLGWAHRVSFADLVREMVVADCQALGLTVNCGEIGSPPPPSA
jgi:GDPmannose 4,6-dehydratase